MQLDYPAFEVIVVDDNSDDETVVVIRSFGDRVRLIAESVSIGPSSARNAAARMAQGQFLAFTDADCIVDRQWLRFLIQGFQTDRVAAVGGAQAVAEDENEFGRIVARFLQCAGIVTDYVRKPEGKPRFVSHNASCNVMYRKDIFFVLGGFMQGLWPGEDVELDYRLCKKGYRLLSNPQAIVYHYRPATPGKFIRMMSRYGWAQGILVRKYGFFRFLHAAPVLSAIIAVMWFIPATRVFAAAVSIAGVIGLALLSGFNPQVFGLFMTGFVFWFAGFWKGFFQGNI